VTWVNVDGLGDVETIRALGEIFSIHPLALEDVVNVPQRPKVEEYEKNLFVVSRMPMADHHGGTEQLSLFLGKDYILTLQERPGDCLEPVRKRVRKGGTKLRSGGADYLAYALLDAVVDDYFPLLEELGDLLERMENDILAAPREAVLHDLHDIKQRIVPLRRILWSFRDVFTTLIRDEIPHVTAATHLYFRDCYDHTLQLIDLLEGHRENSSGLMDLYLSSLSNKMNDVMKILTIVATVFIPLSFIAGIYGMNFNPERSPLNMPELNWFWGYPFALSLMGLMAGAMLLFFRSKGWLGSPKGTPVSDEESEVQPSRP
jgi:magnesium transporter